MAADWKRIREVFEQALDLEPGRRAAFLDETCAGDDIVRREVDAMLAAHDRPGSFLAAPPALASGVSGAGMLREADPTASLLSAGTVVDEKYRIESLLGAGGMGAVYRATHLQLERHVALKVIRGELLADPSSVERFRREAVAVARLRHPNIVTVHDYGIAPRIGAYLVLELLEGRSLRAELAERKRLDMETTCALVGQVCEGVGAAHRAGVVHRDLKPENLFLEKRGGGQGPAAAPVAKVLDFGLAKLEEASRSAGGMLTAGGTVLGTPIYMSPEQCRGDEVDARSDVYALGCVVYEMLTGRPPFVGQQIAALVFKHVDEVPRPASELVPGLASSVDEALSKALAKAPADRHQTAEAFARALGAVVSAAPSGADMPPGRSTAAPGQATGEGKRTTAAKDARTDEAPASASPNNLPRPVTHFVGRERQIAEVRDWLTRSRLVTLAGPGGIGKTRLALEVAERVLDDYEDGVWLVALGALTDPALATHAVASALGVREQGGRLEFEALQAWLREKRLLLVLDNCEHLVEACAGLAQALLEACPGLQLLATSREALGVVGEAVWSVPTLGVPAAGAADALDCESVRLFLDRAALAKPDFEATASSKLTIAAVCRRLEGIPLAIELAAARAKMLSVEQILERLDDRFRLLAGGSRTAPSRQQTLRATLDWSYELLADDERALLRRLSVFSGGWTFAGAEAAASIDDPRPIPSSEILDLLVRLVDKSLVIVRDRERDVRYGMLETIREYALEHLRAGGEAEEAARRHAEYFLALAEEADPEFVRAEAVTWLARLEAEHDNLRAALEWLFEHDAEGCLRLAGSLRAFWHFHGHLREARQWLDAALERNPTAPARLRMPALRGSGELAVHRGDSELASARFEETMRLAEEVGDAKQVIRSSYHLGAAGLLRGDIEAARAYYGKSLAGAKEAGHDPLIAASLNSLGEIARLEGGWTEAQQLYEEAVALFRRGGDNYSLSVALTNLGASAYERGDLQGASGSYREAIALSHALGDTANISLSIDGTASVAAKEGAWERAARLSGAADALREAIGYEMEPADRAFRERYLREVREYLSEADLEAALAEGRAMTPEQAIEYALSTRLIG
jgi:predicted ATPase/serine/threonine protein kinase